MGRSATQLASGNQDTGGENWQPLYNFPYYQVSDKGQVRRTFVYKPKPNNAGYPCVNLSYKNNQRKIAIHRAVWEMFRDTIPPDRMINHMDGDKTNNDISNLELVTNRENIEHYKNNLLTYRGSKVNTAKLTDDIVKDIRAKRENGYSTAMLVKDYGVNKSTINRILSRKNWKHI